MRFSKAEPYETCGQSYQIWVVQTPEGYQAEAINDKQESISPSMEFYPSANEALEAAKLTADADVERSYQLN